jgi:isopentenyl-diphosphate delta-isomerase
MDQVILVDSTDKEIGTMEKLEAHQKGLLHRAFSVFLFNSAGEMLLQQRADSKYHSPGLWTNACCSHPAPNETIVEAGHRRLKEELGIATFLAPAFSFEYRTHFENGLIEHELDHVLIGYTTNEPELNPLEAKAFKWISIPQILDEIKLNPEEYTSWFKIILTDHIQKLQKELCHESM